MMKNLIIRMIFISPLVGVMLTGCTATGDKNQPPPPVEPPVETAAAPAPAPEPPPPPAPKPEVIVIEGVNFDFDKATLKPSAVEILDHAVSVIQQHPDMRFDISGYTDSTGSDAYNDGLSARRANAVLDYLVAHGVSSSRLEVHSYGESNPVADNSTKEGRARNRRVEISPL